MIEYIRGTLQIKQPQRVVIENQGVAFELLIPLSTFMNLGEPGTPVQLKTHLQWREDGPQLFAFLTENERALFRLLTKVNKIGPKLALNIMSSGPAEKLVEMIILEDYHGLTGLKGVGAKLASRLIVELKEAVIALGIVSLPEDARPSGLKGKFPHEKEAREALENLGYSSREIEKALRESAPLITPDADLQMVIETVLRSFSS